MRWLLSAFSGLLLCLLCQGCGEHQPPPSTKRSGAVVRGTAKDIPIYDKETSGPPVDVTKFSPAIGRLFNQVDPAEHIEAYKEEHGHYPKDYAEFKSGVVEPNNLKFPENLPNGFEIQYDEANHRVVVVRKGGGRGR